LAIYTLKIQATLKGYTAWVVAQLVDSKGETQADVVKYLMDRWIDDHSGWLSEQFGLTRSGFEESGASGGKVVKLSEKEQR
jgi:hypothetical protein